ncbi:MAG: MFS transporter [Candidatus Puniceispirillaceae bacterium]|jgi:MFS family permease|nr:MFS transporter [Pseudomonadota bacterium]MDA0844986.1 MFS transporter [Pseudomonadota bacterium]
MIPSSLRQRWLVIMLAGATLVSATLGIRQVFGLFLQPISVELGTGFQLFSLAIAVQNLVWGLSSPLFGAAADRYGPWRVAAIGALLYGGGLFLMASYVTEAGIFMGQILIGLGLGSAGISIAIGAVARAAPPEKRSLAMGLVTSFGSFGQFALVPVTQILMVTGGWQFALLMLSVIMASMVAVAMGLRTPAGSARPIEGPDLTIGAALQQAVRSRDYILLTVGFFVCGLQLVFITTHLPTYLQDAGLSPNISSWALALIGLFNIIGAFICGWLGGVVSKKKSLATVYLLRGITIAAFILIPPTPVTALLFGACMGLLWLGTIPLTSGLIVVFFGPRYLSMLYGLVFLSHQIGSFVGAWLGGIWYDWFGNYEAMWWLNAAAGLFAFAVNWAIREPRPMAAAA